MTLNHSDSTRATATTTIPGNSLPQIGDLFVIAVYGNVANVTGVTGINYTTGSPSGDAGYQRVSCGKSESTTRITDVWWKQLVADDFSGGNFRGLSVIGIDTSAGTSRISWGSFDLDTGVGTHWREVDSDKHCCASVTNNTTIITLTGMVNKGVAVVFGAGWVTSTGLIGFDGVAPSEPYWNEANAVPGTNTQDTQGSYKEYASGDASIPIVGSNGQANTSHAVVAAAFEMYTPPAPSTAHGKADAVASASGTPKITLRAKSGKGDAVAQASATAKVTIYGRGKADAVADARGKQPTRNVAHGKADAVASATGTPSIFVPQPYAAQGDDVAWAYGMPIVDIAAGGRADVVASARAVVATGEAAHGKADVVATSTGKPYSIARVGGLADVTADATGHPFVEALAPVAAKLSAGSVWSITLLELITLRGGKVLFNPPLVRGDTRTLHLTDLVDQNGNGTIFGTGDVLRFTMKRTHADDDLTAIVTKHSGPGGGINMNVGLDTATIELEPADTNDLEGNTRIVWDVQLCIDGDPGNVVTLASGADIIYDDVTVTAP